MQASCRGVAMVGGGDVGLVTAGPARLGAMPAGTDASRDGLVTARTTPIHVTDLDEALGTALSASLVAVAAVEARLGGFRYLAVESTAAVGAAIEPDITGATEQVAD